MLIKTYRFKLVRDLERALIKTTSKLKEKFVIKEITFDKSTDEFIIKIEASENFHHLFNSMLTS